MRDRTISWLVLNRDASVRLRNCIAASPAVGELTVGRFLADPRNTRQLLLDIRSLGRKTADELSVMVAAAALEPSQELQAPKPEPVAPVAFRTLLSLLKPIPFPAALLTTEMSARLRNGLRPIGQSRKAADGGVLHHADLAAVVADWPVVRRRLLAQPSFGRVTITEMERIVERVVGNVLAMISASSAGPSAVSIDDLTEERLDPRHHGALLAAGVSQDMHIANIDIALHGVDPDLRLPPRDHVDAVIARLPRNQQDTIVKRYGLGGSAPQTLEGVASQYYVTRERVRQVEAKALERMRVGASRKALERLLESERDMVWDLLSDRSALVTLADLQDRRADVPEHFMLAVDVLHGTIVDWMNDKMHVALGGWWSDAASAHALEDDAARLTAWARGAPGPIPISLASRSSDVPERHFPTAAKLSTEFHLFEGYLCPGHLGTQARRTCRLHELAVRGHGPRPFDLCTLRDAYAAAYPDDDTLPRSVALQLQRAPHLFLHLFDSIWVPLGLEVPRSLVDVTPFARVPMLGESDFERGSIGAWLHATLARNGPSRTVDLRRQAEIGFPQKIAQSSIGAVLQTNPDFVRIAPGVYALQREAAAWSDPARPVGSAMLSDSQCRYYAHSRKAGDPIDTYPAWNAHLEAALCRWASSNTSDNAYRSLLSVSDPSRWPTEPGEIAVWSDRKRILGSYRLMRLQPPQAMRLPSAPDFLTAAMYLSLTGSIAWTTVNRTAQRRVDDQKAAPALALLVRFGMASSPDHWQARHHALPEAVQVVSAIAADLSRSGRLSWDEGTLRSLRTNPPRARVTTADPDDVQAMLDDGDAGADSGRMMGGAPAPDVESLFDSDDWGSLFRSG